jgi:hypothetical protein
MEYWNRPELRKFVWIGLTITPTLQYSNTPVCRSRLATGNRLKNLKEGYEKA